MFTLPIVFVMNMMMVPATIVQTATVEVQNTIVQIKKKELTLVPKIKKYNIPGQKSLVVVSTKCPTELAGVSTPTSKIFHNFIDTGMSCINRTQILPIELQQVCS